MNPIRVLNILPEENYKEAEIFAMNIYRNINRENIQFDFLFQEDEESIFIDEIKSLGGNVFKIDSLKKVGVYKYRKQAREFFENHKEYEILHCYLDRFSGVILSEAKKAGVRVRIAHMYNKDIKFNRRGYLRFSVNKNSNYKFAYSKEEGNLFFGEFEKFTLLRNVIDLDRFSYKENKRKNLRSSLDINNEVVVGYINKSNKEENNKKIISIFKKIKDENKNSKLIIVLNNDFKEEVKHDVNKYDLSNDVILLDEKRYLEEDVMQSFDVMMFISDLEINSFLIKAQENDLPSIVLKSIDNDLDLNLDLVYSFRPNEDKELLAKNILDKASLRNSIKQNYIKYKMNKLGYDSKKEAKILENFYLSIYGKNNQNVL
ncbi:MAG: hypothetical protein Q4B63_11660 [Clostridium perfringens]|nr:hypothetical protein [Clostridium perfringens]